MARNLVFLPIRSSIRLVKAPVPAPDSTTMSARLQSKTFDHRQGQGARTWAEAPTLAGSRMNA